jgi:hypothetical protein
LPPRRTTEYAHVRIAKRVVFVQCFIICDQRAPEEAQKKKKKEKKQGDESNKGQG